MIELSLPRVKAYTDRTYQGCKLSQSPLGNHLWPMVGSQKCHFRQFNPRHLVIVGIYNYSVQYTTCTVITFLKQLSRVVFKWTNNRNCSKCFQTNLPFFICTYSRKTFIHLQITVWSYVLSIVLLIYRAG